MHTSVFHILDMSKYADVVFFVYNTGIFIICHILGEHEPFISLPENNSM